MGESMDMLIGRQFLKARKSSSGKVDIRSVNNLLLKVVLYTMKRAAGAQEPHEATKSQL